MENSLFAFFTDAILRGPTIASMLVCFTTSLMGVIAFLRKESLIGEVLSHAAYPGVILGIILAGWLSLDTSQDFNITILIMLGGAATAFIGMLTIYLLERQLNVPPDAALCFILSAFFGIGVTLASDVQFTFTGLYRQAQTYLYGQAATMTDLHIWLYGSLSLIVIFAMILLNKELQIFLFNPEYATSLGIKIKWLNSILFSLTVLTILIGIRSVGVVLMSAMLIAPAAAARQYTNRFHVMLVLAAFFGLISGFLGNYLSVMGSYQLSYKMPGVRLALPTGPLIVIVASIICVFSLLFAPERGLFMRLLRIQRFRFRCIEENLLKTFWKGREAPLSFEQISKHQSVSSLYLYGILLSLIYSGWLQKAGKSSYQLTSDGFQKAAHIVRLHRLWEVYLTDYLDRRADQVHQSAEEMEHIITPALEEELDLLLKNPKVDPHQQQIPPKDFL